MTDPPYPSPRANAHLIGHRAAEDELADGYLQGKLHHAWLICGPKGIGKATLAYRFARFILAGGPGDRGLFGAAPGGLAVDESDPVFQRVAQSGHGDLYSVARSYDEQKKRLRTEIVVSDVRGLAGFFSRTAAEGGWRVAVIDAADEMNNNAANAVLKVLEEPPAHTVLLLVCHRPGRLLPTLRSRCRMVTLTPLSAENVTALLAQYRPELPEERRVLLTSLSEGSIGKALQLEETGGYGFFEELLGLLSCPDAPPPDVLHGFCGQFNGADKADAFETVTDLLVWLLGRMIRFTATGTLPPGSSPLEQQFCRISARSRSVGDWLTVLDDINRTIAATKGLHLERRQALLSMFFLLRRGSHG